MGFPAVEGNVGYFQVEHCKLRKLKKAEVTMKGQRKPYRVPREDVEASGCSLAEDLSLSRVSL